jgi:[glutamine synthetase] adenylyltransferase / [glutamine synthetase]-adenylyl-L-tyrosine phosphorylase
VAGSASMGEAFETIRSRVLQSPRSPSALAGEIKLMRDKMHAAHPGREGVFDIKHDSGGLIDAEFAVQYLVLAHAHQHAALTANSGTIALLGAASQLKLIAPNKAKAAQQAYRQLRAEQHRLKLAGAQYARVAQDQFAQERGAITALWKDCLEGVILEV